MDKSRAAAVAVALAAGLAHAQATAPAFAPPNLSESGVRALAAGCAMCHGTEGRPVAGSAFARLAGRSAASIVEAMKAYRDGAREATVMHQIARGYTDAEVAALAAYFEKRSP